MLLIKIFSKINDLKSTTRFILFSIIYVFFAFVFFWALRDETGNLAWAYTIANIIASLLYFPIPFFVFIYLIIRHFSKKHGEGRPLSYEAMKTSKSNIPGKIYKFCSLSTNKTEKLNQDKLNSLKNNQIWLSNCSYLNDPFEGQFFCFPDKIDKYALPIELKMKYKINSWDELKNKMEDVRNNHIQCSFSRDYSDLLMWGYYANGCRGYCVEYNVLKKDHLCPVTYVSKRPMNDGILIDIKQHQIVNKNKLDIEDALKKCNAADFFYYNLYIQSIKSKEWAREKEIRLINYSILNKEPGMNVCIEKFGLSASKIIIGYLCEYKDELIKISKNLGIPFTIMEPSYESSNYKLIEKSS